MLYHLTLDNPVSMILSVIWSPCETKGLGSATKLYSYIAHNAGNWCGSNKDEPEQV